MRAVAVVKKKYAFVVDAIISLHIDVEATDLDEAIALAYGASVMSLCHQCARSTQGEWSTSGELDCDTSGMNLVAVYADGEDLAEADLEAAKAKWQT